MVLVFMLRVLLFPILVIGVFSDTCTWGNCKTKLWHDDPFTINVHVVPHSHDDMGWIKTADDYYTGAHPAGTEDVFYPGVQYIINTVLNELSRNPNRTFSYCETGYLTRWMEDVGDPKKKAVQIAKLKNFVKSGQLELVGGGWVQPDEATSHYVDLIDQYTLGLNKLQGFFDNSECARPKMAWQIDPFGHSREHANLATMMGYEGVFFAREHYLEHTKRVNNKTLEFNWKVSDDLNKSIFGGAFYNHYMPPSQFNWDVTNIFADPIKTDKKLKGYNVGWELFDPIFGFVPYLENRAKAQPHNHVLLLMGSDFLYSDANMWFTNMDKLIEIVNNQWLDGLFFKKINMFYSTPTCYYKAIQNYFNKTPSYQIPNKQGPDFFPYAYNNTFLGGAHSYWSGFYTSKPAFKGFVRQSSALLQLTRKIYSLTLDENYLLQQPKIEKFERAMGLSQHHDAITGTSKEAVTQDYIARLSIRGWDQAEAVLNQALTLLSPSNNTVSFKICRRINETDCSNEINGNTNMTITVFNGHNQAVQSLIRLPYYGNSEMVGLVLRDAIGNLVYNKVLTTFTNSDLLGNSQLDNTNGRIAPYEIYFIADVPALGFTTYFLNLNENFEPPTLAPPVATTQKIHKLEDDSSETTIENEYIKLYFNKTGHLYQYEEKGSGGNGHNYSFAQDFYYYEAYQGLIVPLNNNLQSSGAYIFRPKDNTPKKVNTMPWVQLKVVRTDNVQEVRQIFSNWVSQSIRLISGKKYAEFEWTIGPIPTGKEVITKYTTSDISNAGVFQTDSNGRQMITRKLNHSDDYTYEPTEPVAGNYYPVNTRILISDPNKFTTFAVLTDRTQGGSSLSDGEVELMLHRRLFFDDGNGVDQPLNESGSDGRGLVVRGKHWVFFGTSMDPVVKLHRTLAMEMYNQPFVGLGMYDSMDAYKKNNVTEFSGLGQTLNASANLVTVKQIGLDSILVRLEHVFQNKENFEYQRPIQVDLTTLFQNLVVSQVIEVNLVNTQVCNDNVTDMMITLNPQAIRTFILKVAKKN